MLKQVAHKSKNLSPILAPILFAKTNMLSVYVYHPKIYLQNYNKPIFWSPKINPFRKLKLNQTQQPSNKSPNQRKPISKKIGFKKQHSLYKCSNNSSKQIQPRS